MLLHTLTTKAARLSATLSTRSSSLSNRLASTLIIAEGNNPVSAATLSAVTAAKSLGNDEIKILSVGGPEAPTAAPEDCQVLHAKTESPLVTPETVLQAITAVKDDDTTVILGSSTKFGSSVIPLVSGHYRIPAISDIIEIQETCYIRPMYAGNVWAEIAKPTDWEIQILSIRPTAFEKAGVVENTTATLVEFTDQSATKVIRENKSQSDRPDLTAATTVISGGRGLGNAENFKLLEQLADKLPNAAVGASRAAVDAGYVPSDWQVGQTGKVVAPDIYIAVGISGAIQHISGMKDSKTIFAINKDPEAPIFQIADYGLVEDLFTAVPGVTGKL